MIAEAYQNRKARDERAKELRRAGWRVRVYTMRNQQCHPEYVKDYEGYYEIGIGNTDYKTVFPRLYCLEAEQ